MKPTKETYNEFQNAYNYFNVNIFDNELSQCVITYQRQKKSFGHFSHQRWVNNKHEIKDEIALNPAYFATRSINEILGSLVHEMVHLWQFQYGKPGRGRYHNIQWADKMQSIGLMPYNTKNKEIKTGDNVSHYIIVNGLFDKVCNEYLALGNKISWFDRFIEHEVKENEQEININFDQLVLPEENKNNTRIKYTCPNNHYSVWGKKDIDPICGRCNQHMIINENKGKKL